MIDTRAGVHMTVKVFEDGSARMLIHLKDAVMWIQLSDEERRVMRALLEHDEPLEPCVQELEPHDFKLLSIEDRNKPLTPDKT